MLAPGGVRGATCGAIGCSLLDLGIVMTRVLLLILLAVLVGCPSAAVDDDDDNDDATVVPPDDDDGPGCSEDAECRFSSGLEICEDGACVQGDRNNSLDEAQLLEYDGAADLIIAPAGDIDWFRFNGTAGDLLRIATEADDTNQLDTVIRYFDAQGTEIAFNDDFDRLQGTNGVPPDSWLFTGVPSTGPWYFTVEDARGWIGDPSDPAVGGEDSGYQVLLWRAGAGEGAFFDAVTGERDAADDAHLWEVPEYRISYNLGGFLESPGDTDWIEIPVVRGEVLRLYGFPNSGSAGVTRVTAYMPDGLTPITTFDGPGWTDDRRMWIPVLEDGSYFLEVGDSLGGGGFEYWYWLHGAQNQPPELEDPPLPPLVVETEPNDGVSPEDPGLDLATGPSDSWEAWARINPPGDEDWYAIDAEAGDRLSVTFRRTEAAGESTRLAVELRDPDGDVSVSGSWQGQEAPVFSLTELDATGTWHVVVTEQNPDEGSGGHYYGITLAALRP